MGIANKPIVFIQTNAKQRIGAAVSAYALKRYAREPHQFDVRVLDTRDYDFLQEKEGKKYRRARALATWTNADLQSFTPLRFIVPELMNYTGRALVIDPDVFACDDIGPLLSLDMQGRAIGCRRLPGWSFKRRFASSVMLLECSQLLHWDVKKQFNALFMNKLDYVSWINLKTEPLLHIYEIPPYWNDLDCLRKETKLLHNTRRSTQPWKTGLPKDWRSGAIFPFSWFISLSAQFWGPRKLQGAYVAHPDRRQEMFFFGLLNECLEQSLITETEIHQEMQQKHLRADIFQILSKTPKLPPANVHPSRGYDSV